MSGRPINQDRQNSIALELTTYTGAVHRRCGTAIRYVSGGGCVHCARIISTEQRQARIYLKQMEAQKVASRDDDLLDSPAEDGLEIDDREETEDERKARFEESIEDLM